MFIKYTFRGGVHPNPNKSRTEGCEIEPFPAPKKIIIPLSQHTGAPAKPVVKRGDRVLVGQVIGEAAGFISAPVHSSVSGTVSSIGPFPHPNGRQIIGIEIENDEIIITRELKDNNDIMINLYIFTYSIY